MAFKTVPNNSSDTTWLPSIAISKDLSTSHLDG